MGFWDSISKDMKKGLDDGIHYLKEGTSSVKEWAEDLTEEGKRKIKMFEIKQKIQVQLTELGGKFYDLIEKKSKSPASSPSIQPILKKMDSLKEQLSKLEGKISPAKKKKAKKKSTSKKTASRKKTSKKTASKKK